MPDFTLADILGAQAGAPGPVYEGGPTGNIRLGDVLTALGLGGSPWLDRAQKQAGTDVANYQQGGVPGLLADRGETADLAGGFGGTITPAKGIRAYHGSPYDFEKFDLSKIGTGEGAQSYGHGLYFAENPAVAQEYKRTVGVASQADDAKAFLQREYPGQFNDNLDRDWVKTALNAGWKPTSGKMYEVNINAKPEQFLDWEKSLGQQPEQVKNVLSDYRDPSGLPLNEAIAERFKRSFAPEITGQHAYETIARRYAGPEGATGLLNEAGIPGIRYLDQGSRNLPPLSNTIGGSAGLRITPTETPTHNYVVFNPEIIDILKKYGLAGLTMGGVLQAQSEPPPQ